MKFLGGLAGRNDFGTITNCYATGSVSGRDFLGGLVGNNSKGNVLNCYATGAVTGGLRSMNLGGLAGANSGTITNCSATGAVTGGNSSWCLGGLTGRSDGTITNCYATGKVTGGIQSLYLGGLTGQSGGTIDNCYAKGTIIGGDYSGYLGALIGEIYTGVVSNCYAIGAVKSGKNPTRLGGLVGWSGVAFRNCFWDKQVGGCGDDECVIGKTTAEMQTQSTFTDAGWDFVGETINGTEDIWRMPLRNGYPVLNWQVINFVDYAAFANAWLSTPADANWNPLCDLNQDNVIDTLDLQKFTEHWLSGL